MARLDAYAPAQAWTLHPFGDTSPLTRFVIGLDEALRDYRGAEEAPLLRNPRLSHDPWNEDLFYRHLPVQPPVLGQEKDDPIEVGSPEVMPPDPRQDPLLRMIESTTRASGMNDSTNLVFYPNPPRLESSLNSRSWPVYSSP